MSFVSGQGTEFTWGTVSLLLTSVSLQIGGQSDIDITSMSSKTVEDVENTGKILVFRDSDTAFASKGDIEFSVDFFAESWMSTANLTEMVGLKRDLRFSLPATLDPNDGERLMEVQSKATLKQMSLSVSVGEYVVGNATFKLSGD